MRSATVRMPSPCSLAISRRRGRRAICPSSSMISHRTPDGVRPAIRARSTDASVWPARFSTPPRRARRGNMWPGTDEVVGPGFRRSTRARTVAARSWAEMPVVVPSRTSMLTVKAVPCEDVFFWTIGGRSSSSHRSAVSETQTRPRAKRAMKLTASGVTLSEAKIRSPSFSRSASSTTMICSPRRIRATASSTERKASS